MESRCRLCGEISLELLPILGDLELPSRIFQLYQVKVNFEDQLPTQLCGFCWDMVQNAWLNFLKVQKAQDLLNEILQSFVNDSVDIDVSRPDEINFASSPPSKILDCVSENNPLPLVKNDEKNDSYKVIKSPKPKTKKSLLKKKGVPDPQELSELSIIEFKEDGSCVPKEDLFGWDSYLWICCDCQQNFVSQEELKIHYNLHHNQIPKYSCVDCQKIYSKYLTFLSHVKLHKVTLRFSCDICHKWYPTASGVEKHRTEHQKEPQFICLNCGKTFKVHSALLLHARSHLPAELKNRYQCDQCSKRFGTKPNLIAHKRIHSGIKEYTCDQCGKSFFQKGNLDNHLLTHTAARPFTCSTCNKTFKTLVRLKTHSSVHSGLKPYKCDICGRQFRERGTLKEHHRIHTGDMPFTCEFCGKNFRFKGVLTTHRRQHTGERPYSCNECQHHFTNWPNYNKHMKRRHGINTSVTVRKPQAIPPTGMPCRNPPGTVLAQPINIPDIREARPMSISDMQKAQPIVMQEDQSIQIPVIQEDQSMNIQDIQEESFVEQNQTTFFPVLGLYNIPTEMLQQQRVQ